MRLFARTFVFYSIAILPLTAMAQTPVATPSPKPQAVDETVRVQPRGNDFMPNSPEGGRSRSASWISIRRRRTWTHRSTENCGSAAAANEDSVRLEVGARERRLR